jgi:hypothetical protein
MSSSSSYDQWTRKYNARLCDFIEDLEDSFGEEFPAIGNMRTLLSSIDPYSPMLAQKAWPFLNKNRHFLMQKTPQDAMFDTDDMFGLSTFGMDVRKFWAIAKQTDNAGTIHDELKYQLKLLDKLHECKPFAIPSTAPNTVKDAKEASVSVSKAASVSASVSVSKEAAAKSAPSDVKTSHSDEKKKPLPVTPSPSDEKETKQATYQMQQMMKRLLPLAGDDPELQQDFEKMILNSDANAQEPTEKQHDIFERMLEGLLSNILPSSDVELENALPNDQKNDPRYRAAFEESRKLDADERRRKIRDIFKHMAVPQDSNDPIVKQKAAQSEVRAQDRKTKTKQNSRYRMEAHFNYRLLEFMEHMLDFRGRKTYISQATGKETLYYPQIKETYEQIKALFTQNNATTLIIQPFGEWAVKHHAQLKARDKSILTTPALYDHPFLTAFKMDRLWKSFNDQTEEDLWKRTHRIVTLATVYHDMNNQGFGDLMDIINEVLEDSKIDYDVNPKTFRGHKKLVDSIIDRCAESSGMERFKNIFGKMQNSGANSLDGILQLVDHLTPNLAPRTKGQKKDKGPKKDRFETEDIAK